MDHHHPQQQQYSDPYRALVPSPQPDHVHALQYQHQTQPPQATSPQPQHHHASLVSHFHLLHHLTGVGMQGHVQASSSGLVTRLADAIGTGTRDQSFDVLVEELTSQFARCQQLLNSISGTLSSKSITVEGQRQSLEETRQLLDQRKDLITKYRSSVEDLLKGNTR